MAKFDTHVTLAPQFQRAVRIDLDWGQEAALRGYLCQSSAAATLTAMAGHLASGQQAAFTWTGPYGGGKSSLALMLGTLLGAGPSLRRVAREVLGADLVAKITKPFRVPAAVGASRPWLVVRVAGSRSDVVAEIVQALYRAEIPRVGKRLGEKPDAARVLKVLGDLADLPESGGLLLLMDELGKLLEHVAGTGGDIHFFQELAEVASRSKGRLVVVGILHQAFEQYAMRLGRETRDEWAKIQGRFVDIPLVAAVDEVIELTARAISTNKKHLNTRARAQLVGKVILKNRPSSAKDIGERLDRCWPLHPVTAALLGPVSKRRFGQNERSTFAFLGSFEPLAFREFLKSTEDVEGASYEPWRYWDYLKINLEPAILASPDGHRWAQAADSVLRTEGKGEVLHRRLMKCIALIDLFRNGSGLAASRDVLAACAPEATDDALEAALKDLVDWSVAVYRKHLDAYGVFEGSDFDIDAAANRQLGQSTALDVARLARLAALHPVLPKRHYHTTGALRWFESMLATTDTLHVAIDGFRPSAGAAGRFILVIPEELGAKRPRALCKEASARRDDYPMVVGLPPNAEILRALGRELVAIEALWTSHPELTGDAVARKELHARIATISSKLEQELVRAQDTAEWFVAGEPHAVHGARDLHALASDLCDRVFKSAPTIQSELVNRPAVSSNAQAAINALVAALVTNPTRAAFGFDTYGAERGLYETVYASTGLHQLLEGDEYGFPRPQKGMKSAQFAPLWNVADKLLAEAQRTVPLSEILAAWSRPPFGLSGGVIGLVALAYILSNRSQLAAYLSGTYQPDLQEVFAHEVIRDPSVIALRRVVGTKQQVSLLDSVAGVVATAVGESCPAQPLAIGRALVKFVFDLPPWARRTAHVSPAAAKLRATLLGASDPHKLALVDLPNLAAEAKAPDAGAFLAAQLSELASAYPTMLAGVKDRFLRALGVRDASPAALRAKAEVVKGITGELRVEALAARLALYNDSTEALEGLLSLAANKPPRDWTDLDVDSATLALAELALKFRNAEVLAAVKDRAPSRLAFGLVVGTGELGQAAMRSIDVGNDEMKPVERMTEEVLEIVARSGQEPRLALAALARAGADLIEQMPETEASS